MKKQQQRKIIREDRIAEMANKQIQSASDLGAATTAIRVPGNIDHPDTDALVQKLEEQNLTHTLASRSVGNQRTLNEDPETGRKTYIFSKKAKIIWEVIVEWEAG